MKKSENILNGEKKESDRIHTKVVEFCKIMQHELDNNSHKGDWETFLNRDSILSELYHHLNKLEKTYFSDQNPERMKEYIADCANILLMFGNSYNFYNKS